MYNTHSNSARGTLVAVGWYSVCRYQSTLVDIWYQVRAHILGTATANVVDNSGILDATERAATPTALLHTRLDALPRLRFTPAALQPVTLFADSTNAVQSQRIVIQNTGEVAVRFNITVTPRCARQHCFSARHIYACASHHTRTGASYLLIE